MSIRPAGIAAASLGIAVAAIGGPELAQAPADPTNRCPSGYVCFWSGPHFTGEMSLQKNPASHSCGTTPVASARTVYNRDDQTWDFYADTDCSTPTANLGPGRWDDETSVSSRQ
ncbi:peptidase inhibitor family I36 protein [Nonomuraea insulae]|uniref:Peptidase inhibitor family I36 protein n=1 Tax=Nonomuraea insulae TaxID=1616787 RepID=A0ABW1DF70_9ACTN